jgi:hypothetical protein
MPETVATLFPLSNRLKERLCSDGDGLSFEDMLARSAAIVEKLSADWRAGALRDAERLAALALRMRSEDWEATGLRTSFVTIAHDIHGQAGTFGYSQVGEAALALCEQISARDADGADLGDPRRHLPLIERHLLALHTLLSDDIRDGAPVVLDLRRAG